MGSGPRGPWWVGPVQKGVWGNAHLRPASFCPLEEPSFQPRACPKGEKRCDMRGPALACSPSLCVEERAGAGGSGGQVVSREARHADLGAALAQDGELGASVHPAAGQGRVPMLEVHGEVAVHLPTPPLTFDFCLHLQGATWAVTSRWTSSPTSCTCLPAPGPCQTGAATSSRTLPTPKLQLGVPSGNGMECSEELTSAPCPCHCLSEAL